MSVHDVDRQADFYVEKLGLPLLFRVPGTAMAFFDAGSFRLYVDQWYEGAPVSRPVLYFNVPSVPEAHDALVAAGVSRGSRRRKVSPMSSTARPNSSCGCRSCTIRKRRCSH